MRRECGRRFPRHRGLAIPTCLTARASRMCRDACRYRKLVVSFEVGGGENLPGLPGACTTRNFTHLVRGPWKVSHGSSLPYVTGNNYIPPVFDAPDAERIGGLAITLLALLVATVVLLDLCTLIIYCFELWDERKLRSQDPGVKKCD